MKKVLVFSPHYPPFVGGLESHAAEFNHYLSLHNYEITVFTTRIPFDTQKVEQKGKIKIIRYPAWEIIPNYPLPNLLSGQFWKGMSQINKIKFDWVITRTRFFATSLMGGIYAKIRRIKWLHVEHGSDFVKLGNKANSALARIYDYTLGKIVLMWADKVVANSNASAEFCKKLYKGRKYGVIYRGIENEELKKIEPNTKLRAKWKKSFVILFAGRLIDGKGVGDLIQAVKKIKNNGWKLVIIGDGPRRNDWEKMATKQIEFLGQKSRNELLGIMKVCDLVVNPSYTEGLPTSMIEAAFCKKPVVATDVGGTNEIVKDGVTGYLVKPKDIDGLKEKIEMIMKKPLVINKLPKKFDWKNNIKEYIMILV